MHAKFKVITASIFAVLSVRCTRVNAGIRISILDFGLNDITSLLNTQSELIRTGSLKPLLEQAIGEQTGY
jgi:hypothetical protein